MAINFPKDLAIEIFVFANTALVLILFANPTAKHGPLTADIFVLLKPFFLKIELIFDEIVLILLSIKVKPLVSKTKR